MGSQRVFEIAREYGIRSEELILRIASIGIKASDHLTTLDADSVAMVREMLNSSPTGDMVEKRVNRTVRRRRARRKTREEIAAEAAAEAAAAPSVPEVVDEPPVAAAPEPVSPVVQLREAPPVEPTPEPAAEPVAAPEPPAPAAPVVEAAAEAPPAEPAAEVSDAPVANEPEATGAPEPVANAVSAVEAAPAAAVAAAADATAATPAADGNAGLKPTVLPQAPKDKPTSTQAVVVTRSVDRRVLEAVQRTRAEKGYDVPEGEEAAAAQTPRRPSTAPGAAQPGREQPARPGDDRRKKRPGAGRRLVIDNRRDRLVRRGMLDHDEIFRGGRGKKKRPKARRASAATSTSEMKVEKRVVKMGDAVRVGDLAQQLMVKTTQVIGKLMQLGIMATVNQSVDFDTATMIADEFGWRVESRAFDLSDYLEKVDDETKEKTEPRPPVVTVMGHVDHGKTSLLDRIRQTTVADGEAGGITQHIGAYTVQLEDKGTVVFIDTPGHEAFTAMRARGSKSTDIVILVVAADDGVMPQTIESINHARAADVPIIVAVNKIDKNNANPDRVLTELSEQGLVAEEWGGDTVVCKVSALKGEGIENLLEMLLIQAELMELSASTQVPAQGIVLEGRLEKGRGPVATLLVLEGELKVGDTVVSGQVSGRIRALTDDKGRKVQTAGPSMPVEVIGLNGVPNASDSFNKVKDDRAAKKVIDHREDEARASAQVKNPRVSLDQLTQLLAAGEVKELNVIVKADVHGSGEALRDSLVKLSHPEVAVKVIHTAVGGITESDVNLASASNAIIIGFGVRPEAKARRLAEKEHVEIKLYNIIYDALDDVKAAMAGMLSPLLKEKTLGHASVRMTFSVPKVGTIAGCYVDDGTASRSAKVRLIRDNITVYEGSVTSLRRFKNDAKDVQAGYECGIGVGYNDIKEGDVFEFYEIEQIAATLD